MLKSGASGKRFEEITAGKGFDAAAIVNEERQVSLAIPIIRDLVINKYIVTGKSMLDKFLGAFNPIYLFSRGENAYDVFMISGQSYMYLIDGVFIVFGVISLSGTVLWLLPLIAITVIPTIISVSGTTYGLRSGMLFPLLCGLSAMGIYWAYQKIAKKWRVVFMVGVAGIYLISFIYFLIMYWYRTPFEMGRGWFFHERALTKYLSLLKTENSSKIIVSAENPVDMMYNYAFYMGKYNDKNFALNFNQAIKSGNYEMEGINFTKKCPIKIEKNTIYIYERSLGCVTEPNRLARISEAKDGGARFFMPEEKLCQNIELKSYPYPRVIGEFLVEKMDKKTFCEEWVSKP